jgi:3'-phosphoadenosine 5'-phosphosulfate (PAPS) 3'-phosphatase
MDSIILRDLTSIPNSKLIKAGGAGYKFLTILDGLADVYVYPVDGTKRWDTCAPEAPCMRWQNSPCMRWQNDGYFRQ